tara:strand:- start:139 stop:378 length:240 start_codon:yes stop_codon:yes gene_type:complete
MGAINPRMSYAGFPTYWALSAGSQNISNHPLFIKYSYTDIGNVNLIELKASIAAIPYDGENATILAYLLTLLNAAVAIA